MSRPPPCQIITVASSPHCEISRCEDCGTFHVHIGAMSVRLPARIFDDVAGCIQVAMLRVQTSELALNAEPVTPMPGRNH